MLLHKNIQMGNNLNFFYLSPTETFDYREEPNIKLLDKYWGGLWKDTPKKQNKKTTDWVNI